MTINTYLTFNGDCEAAFKFYENVFGKEIDMMSRFSDMPPDENFPVSEEEKNRIMHVSMPISNETILMGSDTGGAWADGFKQGTNFSLSINTESKAEADRMFEGLSEGGQATMPMADTFWGSYFGMLTDKFGISWMVSYDDPNRQK